MISLWDIDGASQQDDEPGDRLTDDQPRDEPQSENPPAPPSEEGVVLRREERFHHAQFRNAGGFA